MDEQTNARTGRPSLRLWLVIIIVLCWAMPIILVGGVMSYYITHNITDQIIRSVNASVENAVDLSAAQIDSAVMASRYVSYNTTIRDAYAAYQVDSDATQLYGSISQFLTKQYKYDAKFLLSAFFFLEDPDGIYYTYNETNNSTYHNVRSYRDSVHQRVQELSPQIGTGMVFLNVDGMVYLVRNLMDAHFAPFGVLVLQLDAEDMFAGLKTVAWQSASTIWLDGTPVVLDGEALDPEELSLSFTPNRQSYRSEPGVYYVYGMNRTETARISYIVEIDSTVLLHEQQRIQSLVILLVGAVLPFLAVILYFFTLHVNTPIKKLIRAAQSIEHEAYGVTVDKLPYNKEFSYLTEAFNRMSCKLQYQFNRIYKEELALRDARIMALQSQINPHFLNNTLEIINWEARIARNGKITQMIEALSSMLNAATDRGGKPIIRLSEEMMYVDSYLYIISVRFGKRLKITKEVDPAVLDCYVPRLITQPIIENAVEHGIQPKQTGEIAIRAFQEEQALIIEVENNGTLTEENNRRIELLLNGEEEATGSLGIRNVHQRLRILYGNKSGISVDINKQGNTLFRITIGIEPTKQ